MSSPAPTSKAPEFEPPQACVNRVVKSVLADNVQVTKDARAAITRAAGIFIFYLTHCANDFCKEHKRQTIYTTDVLEALKELDFGEFEGDVEEFIEQYRRETETKKSSQPRSKSNGEEDKNDDGDDEEKEETQEENGGEEGSGENDVVDQNPPAQEDAPAEQPPQEEVESAAPMDESA